MSKKTGEILLTYRGKYDIFYAICKVLMERFCFSFFSENAWLVRMHKKQANGRSGADFLNG